MNRKGLGAAFLAAVLAAGCSYHDGNTGRRVRMPKARAVWSFFIPGTGQYMNGEVGKGALMTGMSATAWISAERSRGGGQALQLWFVAGIGMWSAIDAYKVADRPSRVPGLAMQEAGEQPCGVSAPCLVGFTTIDPFGERLITTVSYRF